MADERQMHEKDEKDEKEMEKHDEKVDQRDMLSSITWALILIWAGLVYLAANTGWLEDIGIVLNQSWQLKSVTDWTHLGVWNLIALGAGVILVLEAGLRLVLPSFRRHVGGTLITAAVFIALGLRGWFGWATLWPLILIAVGINILVSGIRRKGA